VVWLNGKQYLCLDSTELCGHHMILEGGCVPPEIFRNRNGRSSFIFKTLNQNVVLDFMQRLLLFSDVTHTHGLPEIVLKLGCLYFIEFLQ